LRLCSNNCHGCEKEKLLPSVFFVRQWPSGAGPRAGAIRRSEKQYSGHPSFSQPAVVDYAPPHPWITGGRNRLQPPNRAKHQGLFGELADCLRVRRAPPGFALEGRGAIVRVRPFVFSNCGLMDHRSRKLGLRFRHAKHCGVLTGFVTKIICAGVVKQEDFAFLRFRAR